MGLVAVEGGVCAGKSTVVQALSCDSALKIIPEYMHFIPFDHAAHKNLLPPDERLWLFLQIEQARIRLALEKPKSVSDRCIFTVIAFELALESIGFTSSIRRMRSFGEISVLLPDVIYFLRIPNLVRENRWLQRKMPSDSLFLREDFNACLEQTFMRVSACVPVQFLDAALMPVSAIATILSEELSKSCDSPKVETFANCFRFAS